MAWPPGGEEVRHLPLKVVAQQQQGIDAAGLGSSLQLGLPHNKENILPLTSYKLQPTVSQSKKLMEQKEIQC